MSHRGEVEPLLNPSVIPDAEAFSGYLETIATIETNIELAPKTDVPFHQVVLDGVKNQAREYLLSKPEVVDFYRTVGRIAASQTEEEITREIHSSAELIKYVQAGLLDTLTVSELESRIRLARLKGGAAKHSSLLEAAFGDLLHDTDAAQETEMAPSTLVAPIKEPQDSEAQVPDEEPEIIKILASSQLSSEMRSFVQSALHGNTKLLTLRNHDPAISGLDEDKYKAFKADLPAARAEVIALLHNNGVSAHWEVAGATRGTTYRLVIGEADTPIVTDQEPVHQPPKQKKQPYHLEKFSADLFKVSEFVISSNHPFANKQSYISERIAEWLDIPLAEASVLIDRQIKYGWLAHVGTDKNTPLVEVVGYPVEPTVVPSTDTTSQGERVRKSRTRAQHGRFTSDDILAAHNLFNLIASAGNHTKGVGLQRLCEHLGFEERDAKIFIARLAKAGVCKTTQVLEDSANIPKSRKTTVVKFPSRGAWSRFKSNPTDYLGILPLTQ